MSSARNHARRSRKTEHAKAAGFSASSRRMYIRKAQKPQRSMFLRSIFSRLRKAPTKSAEA